MRGTNTNVSISAPTPLNPREKSLDDLRKRLKEHKELSAKLKQSSATAIKKINYAHVN
jgi:ribosomal protein L29